MKASQLEKIEKTLGRQTLDELGALSAEELKQRVVQANQAMQEVLDELEANEKYQQIRADKSFLEQGKRDVNKRQNAVIKYALHLMLEKGMPSLSSLSTIKELKALGATLEVVQSRG